MAGIVHFQRQVEIAPSYDRPRPDRLVAGDPLRTTWEHYLSADGQFSCGIWACEPGCWQIRFAPDKEEFFCVLEGQVRLHDEAGVVTDVCAGEAAVIPAGFVGKFEVCAAVRKYFVVVDRSVVKA